jgi:hypothetical protein
MPGALLTAPLGLNNRGQIVGVYVDGDGLRHGHLLERGRFTTIDVPGAVETDAFGINDRGQIVGAYRNVASPPPSAENPDVVPDLVASEPAAGQLAVGGARGQAGRFSGDPPRRRGVPLVAAALDQPS